MQFGPCAPPPAPSTCKLSNLDDSRFSVLLHYYIYFLADLEKKKTRNSQNKLTAIHATQQLAEAEAACEHASVRAEK